MDFERVDVSVVVIFGRSTRRQARARKADL